VAADTKLSARAIIPMTASAAALADSERGDDDVGFGFDRFGRSRRRRIDDDESIRELFDALESPPPEAFSDGELAGRA